MAITQQFENGTGSQTQYTLLFPYVAAEDVKVTIGGVLQDQDDPTEGYEIDGEILTFLTAPPAGTDNIRIYRETDVESLRATFFAGSQLKAEDLNLNFNQTNYKNQETDNLVSDKWSKETATVYSTDAWDSDDDVVATTEAIDNRIDSKVDSALTTDVVAGDGLTITDNSPASGQITVGITNSGVTTAKIADSNVTTVKIADANITTAKIANSGVTTDKINNSAVTTAKIADSNVTTAKIADANVTTVKIADSNVTTAKIADGNVTTAKITDGNVTTVKVADSGITTDKIADSGVTTAKIADGAVTASKILDASITSSKLADATIVTDAEQAASTPNDTSFFTTSAANTRFVNATGDTMSGVLNMGSNLISDVADPVNNSDAATKGWVASQVASGTVADATYGDIEVSNAGTTWELVAGAISNDDINSSAGIDPSKIYGTAVTLIDTGTVTSTMIADGTIVDGDINASAAINKTKINGTAITAADTGTVTSTMIADGTIVNADINATAEIAVSKLADGAARQLLQTDAAGTGVEWTDNVDIPGTLDVTGATTLDGDLTIPDKIIHAGDTDTTIRFSGADTVAVETAGTERVEFGTTEVVFNDGGENYDFRIEGDTNVNLLFVDASTDRVGIGSSAPDDLLHLSADNTLVGSDWSLAKNLIRIEDTDTNQAIGQVSGGIVFEGNDSNAGAAGVQAVITANADSSSGGGQLRFHTAPANTTLSGSEDPRLIIDGNGRLLAGTSTSTPLGPAQCLIQSFSTSRGVFGGAYFGNDALGPTVVLGKSRGTTVGSYNIVNDDDLVGSIIFAAADGTDLASQVASIKVDIDAPPGSDDTPGRLIFSTTSDGDSLPTEQMTIDRNGNVGIGRYPTEKLDVYKSSGRCVVEVDSDSLGNGESAGFSFAGGARNGIIGIYNHSGITNPCAYLHLDPEDGTNNYLWVDNSNVLRISTSLANIGTTGGTVVGTQTSDERIKNILGPVEYGLDTLKQIETVRYSLKSEPEAEKIGFIAQQVQPLVPESVYDTGDHIEGEPEGAPTMLGMEYVALVPVLVNAVKELSAEVDALKAQLQAS